MISIYFVYFYLLNCVDHEKQSMGVVKMGHSGGVVAHIDNNVPVARFINLVTMLAIQYAY